MTPQDKALAYLTKSIEQLFDLLNQSTFDALVKDGKESLNNQKKILEKIKNETKTN